MSFAKARVIIAGVLFVSWLGFLLYLVLETNTVLISRPQFLIAQAVVVVSVAGQGGKAEPVVTLKEVLKGDDPQLQQLAGKKMRLADLAGLGQDHGYTGPGDYVIPLNRRAGVWQIAPVPVVGAKRLRTSHASLEMRNAGGNPDCVLDCVLEFARVKPDEGGELVRPFLAALALRNLGPAFFQLPMDWRDAVELPRGPLPGRLPIEDAKALQGQLQKCGAKVEMVEDEVRIYPWIAQVRGQVERVLAGK